MTYTKNTPQIFTSKQLLRLLTTLILTMPPSPPSLLQAQTTPDDPNSKNTSLRNLPELNDALFAEDLIQEVSARSRIECSKECVETEGCVMCTFHSSSSSPPPLLLGSLGQCRLHSRLKTASDANKLDSPGARSLARRQVCEEGSGYSPLCGLCLMTVNPALGYTQARDDCRLVHGGHLVIPTSSDQVRCLWNYLVTIGLDKVWVGADDLETAKGEYRWLNGTSLPTDSALWRGCQNSEPDVRSKQNCVNLRSEGPCIYDSSCSKSYAYICQRDTFG